MPFDDEISPSGVTVHAYRPDWVAEAAGLAEALAEAVLRAVAIEHIGSTSIPGMAAEDCLDMMIVIEYDGDHHRTDPLQWAATSPPHEAPVRAGYMVIRRPPSVTQSTCLGPIRVDKATLDERRPVWRGLERVRFFARSIDP